jgi:hypothetical protein
MKATDSGLDSTVIQAVLFDTRKATVRLPPAVLFDLNFCEALPLQIEFSEAPLMPDAGLLPLRPFDERIGLTTRFARLQKGNRRPSRANLLLQRSPPRTL